MSQKIHLHCKSIGQGRPIFLLHGFSEDSSTWDNILDLFDKNNLLYEYSLHCIDLVGHGQSTKPDNLYEYSMESIIENIHDLTHEILTVYDKDQQFENKYILLGYSLGGRIASHYAIKYPMELHAVMLESASFGIAQAKNRLERKQKDAALAKNIMVNGIEFFEKYWSSLDIFKTQTALNASTQNAIKRRRLQNKPQALANTLLMTGQGNLPYIKENFLKLCLPTLYICGEFDVKYCTVAYGLHGKAKFVQVEIIKCAGHNVHTEKPVEFFQSILNFLNSLTTPTIRIG